MTGKKKSPWQGKGIDFSLKAHQSYPADTEKINDLVYKIANIQVKKKVTKASNKKTLQSYNLGEKPKYLIQFFGKEGKRTLSLQVGKNSKEGGNYLLREGKKDVYLSLEPLWFQSSPRNFIDSVFIDIKQKDIESIFFKSPRAFKFFKKGEDFALEIPKRGSFKKDKVKDYARIFNLLRFDEFYLRGASEVSSLNFTQAIDIILSNGTIYHLTLAKKKTDHFVKLEASVREDIEGKEKDCENLQGPARGAGGHQGPRALDLQD